MDSGVYMALISGVIGGVRSGATGAANRLSPVSPRLTLGDRLGERFGERLGERFGERFGDRLGERGLPLAASNISEARSLGKGMYEAHAFCGVSGGYSRISRSGETQTGVQPRLLCCIVN